MPSLTDLPYNVLDNVVDFCDHESQLTLASMSWFFRFKLCSVLYANLMIVDAGTNWRIHNNGVTTTTDGVSWTLVPSTAIASLLKCLNSFTFAFVKRIVVNTHGTDHDQDILALYEKMAALWSRNPHCVSLSNHDVLNLRSVRSFTNFLAQDSVQFIDVEDEDRCEIKRKDHKVLNLTDWFVFGVNEFLALPYNPHLRQLNLYVESNAYLHNSELSENLLCQSPDVPAANLRQLTRLYLHSPLATLRFNEMLYYLHVSDLKLSTLSLTTSHRARNNMMIEFGKVQPYIDLNHLDELELKMSCTRQHECSDNCIFAFFDHWRAYNARFGLKPSLRKLVIVHYKSLTDTTQFKRVVEEFVFSPFFSSLREVYLNLSDSVKTNSQHYSIDLKSVCDGMSSLPHLECVHISSFMNEWIGKLPELLNDHDVSYKDALTNRCNCARCNRTRSLFVELAKLDKSNNYTHKGRVADVEKNTTPQSVATSIDYSEVANVKYLQYVAGQLRKQEHCMERNLHSVGSMLLMNEMPFSDNSDMVRFKELIIHSSLGEFRDQVAAYAPRLRYMNLGGVTV